MEDEARVDECRWCHVPIREVPVLVGKAPGHLTPLWIGVEPDERGEVIERSDGVWRRLARYQRGLAIVPAYRVHFQSLCDPAVAAPRVDPPRFAVT